ncbi:hypothetical protein [Amycolatopsis sp. NPDC059657]|uniref:hypothetical protein n=1 Tax=Amycolatopsis sp. NPDC059657 TaxID=3346899 RepID=UPI0036710BFB
MGFGVAKRQQAMVSHRMSFWGRLTETSTVSWKYQGRAWEVVRPDDGQPAVRSSMECAVCGKRLTFAVRSIAATMRRRACWRALVWIAGPLVPLGFVGVVVGPDTIGLTLTFVAIAALFVGGSLWWVGGEGMSSDVGVTGHRNGWPGNLAKHQIVLAEARPDDQPELVCPKCGHEEEYRWGGHLRPSFVKEQYEQARARFERHTCR